MHSMQWWTGMDGGEQDVCLSSGIQLERICLHYLHQWADLQLINLQLPVPPRQLLEQLRLHLLPPGTNVVTRHIVLRLPPWKQLERPCLHHLQQWVGLESNDQRMRVQTWRCAAQWQMHRGTDLRERTNLRYEQLYLCLRQWGSVEWLGLRHLLQWAGLGPLRK